MSANTSTFLCRSCCALIVGCAAFSTASAADVVVRLQDGRTVTGTIDTRTNSSHLWLHSTKPSIVLLSRFAWADVLSARYEGKRLSVAALRPLAMKVRTKFDQNRFKRRRPHFPAGAAVPMVDEGFAHPPRRPADSRVGSMQIEARIANWDNDPEDDGLLIHIYPQTTDGQLRPVDGRLNLKLFGRVNQPSLRRPHFPELTRNSVRVRAADFGPDGAIYKFPFRNFHPEKNLDIDPFGLLTGRLVVAGQGTFDASDANVRLQRVSRFRDQLQFQSGTRFLPAENPRRFP